MIRHFGTTCNQFAIENSREPTNARYFNCNVFDLLSRSRFTLSVEVPIVLTRLCNKIKKYERRGYVFAGLQLTDQLALSTEDIGSFSLIHTANNMVIPKVNEVVDELTGDLPNGMSLTDINSSRVLEALNWLKNHHD